MDLVDQIEHLACPACKNPLSMDQVGLVCIGCGARYNISSGRPVLLRSDNPLFNPTLYLDRPRRKVESTAWFLSASVNLSRTNSISEMVRRLPPKGRVLVVGGGTQRASLSPLLHQGGSITVTYTDIDADADVDIFCDAHDLPFVDECFDAVVTTAVLEHVIRPEIAAQEITRVLRSGGLIYSELPFLQAVHEGAYDFTRYTLSGHRRLFGRFREIASGMVAGPGTVLVWSLESLASSFFSTSRLRSLAKGAMRLSFFWVKYLDYLLKNKPEALDGASCTYFLGCKSQEGTSDQEIVSMYLGGKHTTHV